MVILSVSALFHHLTAPYITHMSVFTRYVMTYFNYIAMTTTVIVCLVFSAIDIERASFIPALHALTKRCVPFCLRLKYMCIT